MVRTFCVSALIALCLCSSVIAQNLVSTPDFESGVAIYTGSVSDLLVSPADTRWYTKEAETDARLFWANVSGAGRAGGYCAVATAGADAQTNRNAIGLRQTSIPLAPSTTYCYSFWYKTEGSGWDGSNSQAILDPQIHELTSDGSLVTWYGVGGVVSAAAPTWTYHYGEFTTGTTTGFGRVKFNLNLWNPGTDKFYIDDVNISLKPYGLTNGGFESGALSPGWSVSGSSLAIVTLDKHSGTYCVARTGDDGIADLTQAIPVNPGKIYEISYWYKIVGGSGRCINDTQIDGERNWDLYLDQTTPTSGWVRKSATIESGTRSSINLLLRLQTLAPSDILYIDDVAVTDIGPSGDTTLNLNFEAGSTVFWTANGQPLDIVSTESHTGTYSALRTGTTGICDLSRQVPFAVKANTLYELSYWYKKVGSAGRCLNDTYVDGIRDWNLYIDQATPTSGWVRKSTTIDTGSRTAFNILFRAEVLAASDMFYIDDVALTELGSSGNTMINLDFEAGSTVFWNVAGSPMAVVSTEKHSGTYSALRTGDTGLSDLTRAAAMTVKPNTTYELSFWYKFNGSGSTRAIIDNSIDGAVRNEALFVYQTNPTAGWVRKSTIFDSGSRTSINALFRVQVPDSSSDQLYVDDFALTEVGPSGTNLNMGFELGNTASWNIAGATLDVVANPAGDPANTSSYTALLTGQAGVMSEVKKSLIVAPNTTYNLSYLCKIDRAEGQTGDVCSIDGIVDEVSRSGFGINQSNTTGGWLLRTTQVETGSSTSLNLWLRMITLSASDNLYLDELTLTEIPITNVTSAGAARSAVAGTVVQMKGVVTRAISPSQFFVQYVDTATLKMDKSSAILVDCGTSYALTATPSSGDVYTFKGVVAVSDDAKFQGMPVLSLVGNPVKLTPNPVLTNFTPVATTCKTVLATTGTNLDAMFVKLVGKVTQVGSIYYLADLSGGTTGTIRLDYITPSVDDPIVGSWYSVQGNLVTGTSGTTITKSIMFREADLVQIK